MRSRCLTGLSVLRVSHVVLFSSLLQHLSATDCNGNFLDDGFELANGMSTDCNSNQRPDECDLAPEGAFPSAIRVYPVASVPIGLAAADLDGDGSVDLAIADRGAGDDTNGAVDVSWNSGRAEFARQSYQAQGHPRSIVSADLDADGKADLALTTVAQSGDEAFLFVLFNRPGAGFQPVHYALRVGAPAEREAFPLAAGDLDGNGEIDLAFGHAGSPYLSLAVNQGAIANVNFAGETTLSLLFNAPSTPLSQDRNRNWIPDECETVPFRRGDANIDGKWDLTDALAILGRLFLGEPALLPCAKSGDSDDNGRLDLTDALHLLEYLFLGGPTPAEPFPACDLDPTSDLLGCNTYPPCR